MTDTVKLFHCLICEGTGLVPPGFYSRPAIEWLMTEIPLPPEKCRNCQGTGITYRYVDEEVE